MNYITIIKTDLSSGMKKRLNNIFCLLNKEKVMFHSVSLGVFFFILFFQPFPPSIFDFYYGLLFMVGFGAIILLILFLVRILYPCMIENNSQSEKEITLSSYTSGFIIWLLSSAAFVFYLRYVGFISISDYLVFKVVLICLAPPVILVFYDKVKKIRLQNESLISEKIIIQRQVDKYEEDYQNLSIDFKSDNNGGKLRLLIADILIIKSADNYVAIHYLEGDKVKKKLIRSTLKNIDLQIKPYSNFVRCHRTCIVNTHFIEKLNGNCNNHLLTIKGVDKPIPVSRKYFLKIKEAI